MQLLAGANHIDIDFSLNETHGSFSGAQKCEYVCHLDWLTHYTRCHLQPFVCPTASRIWL